MSTFHYRALKPDGTVVEGDVNANVMQEAYRKMEFCRLLPINVSPVLAAEETPVVPPEAAAPAGEQFDEQPGEQPDVQS